MSHNETRVDVYLGFPMLMALLAWVLVYLVGRAAKREPRT